MAAVRAALLAPLLALGRAGPGPATPARVEVAVSGPGPAGPAGAGGAAAVPGGSYTLRGAVLGAGGGRAGPGRGGPRGEREEMEIRGRLVLVSAGGAGGCRHCPDWEGRSWKWRALGAALPVPTQCPTHQDSWGMGVGDVEPELSAADSWIGVVPVGTEEPAEGPRGAKEESFTTTVVTKMKRALVLGASALLILALNQNAIRELDVSQLLAKPVVIIQSSDNVTRLLGALLRGLQATAKITYQAVLLENLGVTLTLWSTCGLSRGGLYGEWQGVICPGESSSQVQKYLQQLWNTILLIALLLCTGVMVQAQRQSRQDLSERDAELDLKQHIRRRLSALKTRRYHPGKPPRSRACEIDSCAVCLDQFHKSQWLRVLPCSHEFHRDCVDPWLLLQQTCPLCKRNILGNCCTDS
ncbi:RING finger protein 215 [Lonchura striata]|uniref:RING finger protein 215 n=1 Tax=Lonchura striata TaxID=40157 RepID=A0A218UI69_9PASE|nr:RING finger protein 215 [Lonchura striata domestica]